MDNNKMLIGFVAILVAFLAFPVVMQKMKQQQTAVPGAAPVSTAPAGSAPAGSAPAGAVPAAPPKANPELDQPPLLNEANLTGTSWPVESSGYRVKVTLAPGGVLYMTHPMAKALTGMDYIEGRWRVEYNKVFVEAAIGGNSLARELRIGGNKLYSINDRGEAKVVEPY